MQATLNRLALGESFVRSSTNADPQLAENGNASGPAQPPWASLALGTMPNAPGDTTFDE